MAREQFINREHELDLLRGLYAKKSASLVVCKGRRRIGKSRLIQQFAGEAQRFLEFQGLPPREGITCQDQLDAFAEQLSRQTTLPRLTLSSWDQAFSLLASILRDERTVVLLDEISWMSGGDKDFAGQLKIAWDTQLKTSFPRLVLVACGSVSSWIDQNIAGSTGFVGRVSLELVLEELSLYHCNLFWGKRASRVSATEKLKLLAITGGIPRYLEEINSTLSAEENVKRLCFSREGILFREFDRIFADIFSRRAGLYRDIVGTLIYGSRSISEICQTLGRGRSGHVSRHVADLVASGFITQDLSTPPSRQRPSRAARFRLRDNYLRFYLRYIEPIRDQIRQGLTEGVRLEALVDWDVIMGFQFQNLVLNNLRAVCRLLSIDLGSVRSAAPYYQKKTQRKSACQIDLLIQTRLSLYVCELKFRRRITHQVIREVQQKIMRLKPPSEMTVRPVLIFEGKLDPRVEQEDYFDRCIRFSDLLGTPPGA